MDHVVTRLKRLGWLALAVAIPAAAIVLAVPGLQRASLAASTAGGGDIYHPVAFTGMDFIDLKWPHVDAYNDGYSVYRDGVQIARTGIDDPFYHDADPALVPWQTYSYHICGMHGETTGVCYTTQAATLGRLGGTIYRDQTWGSGTYTLYQEVRVYDGALLFLNSAVLRPASTNFQIKTWPQGTLNAIGSTFVAGLLTIQDENSDFSDCQFISSTLDIQADVFGLLGNTYDNSQVRFLGGGSAAMRSGVFTDGARLVNTGSGDLLVSRNTFYKSNVVLYGTGSNTIRDNTFLEHGGRHDQYYFYPGITIGPGAGKATVQGNTFEYSDGSAIEMHSGGYRVLQNILISKNPGGYALLGGGSDDDPPEIKNNLVIGWLQGIWVGSHAFAVIENNTLMRNSEALKVDHAALPEIHQNCIAGNTYGLSLEERALTATVNARFNWWGDASGPRHENNPGGIGDAINKGRPVDYSSWLLEENCVEGDLALQEMDALQVVAGTKTYALVSNKPAIVRLLPRALGNPISTLALVRGYRDDQLLGILIAPRSYSIDPGADFHEVEQNPRSGFMMRLPPEWLTGTLTLVGELLPEPGKHQFSLANDIITQEIEFIPRPPYRVAFAPISFTLDASTPPVGPDLKEIPGVVDRMLRPMLPVSNVVEGLLSPLPWRNVEEGISMTELESQHLLHELTIKLIEENRSRAADQAYKAVVGVFPGGLFELTDMCAANTRWGQRGYFGKGLGLAVYCFINDEVIVHEMGHLWGLRHMGTPDDCNPYPKHYDWPYADATIQMPGYDLLRELSYPPSTTHDLESYCPAKGNFDAWISPFHYNKMFASGLDPAPVTARLNLSKPAGDSEEVRFDRLSALTNMYLLVQGTITATGGAALQGVRQFDSLSPPPNPPAGSAYCLELQDEAGSALSSRCFDLDQVSSESGEALAQEEFLVVLDWVPGGVQVALKKGTAVLAQQHASSHPPQVQVLQPNGGESLGSTLDARWLGSDQDGGQLHYNLYASCDGKPWTPILSGLEGSQVQVTLPLVPGGSACRLRVEANDGFYTASDTSDGTFSIANHAPLPGIYAPEDGSQVDLPLHLLGGGFDPDEGELDGAALRWSSDKDGALGEGGALALAQLSTGWHTITLQAQDSQGLAASTSIRLEIRAAIRPLFLPMVIK
jgi:hypothetical protein